MYTSAIAVYMAKLYWRIKVNGKWTWRAASIDTMNKGYLIVQRIDDHLMEEEE